jgi:DNA-binding SARP family transcriptional activator
MASVPAAQVRLLDGFDLQLGDGRARRSAGELPHAVQRLVAHLCLNGRPTRTFVAGQLWPEVAEKQAHGSLRSALWRLQKAAPGVVEVWPSGLRVAEGVRVDVRELSDWARRTRDASVSLDDLAPPDAGVRGDLLPGWYDDWVLLERERLRQLRMHALEAAAGRLAGAARFAEALEAAHAAVRAEPLRETAQCLVMKIHLAEGNVAEAVRVYERFREMLADDLGVLPSARMSGLARDLRLRPRGPVV